MCKERRPSLNSCPNPVPWLLSTSFPSPSATRPHDRVLPAVNADIVRSIRHFVVEEIRTARRFLKAVDRNIDIDALTFYEMGKHADHSRFSSFLAPCARAKTWV